MVSDCVPDFGGNSHFRFLVGDPFAFETRLQFHVERVQRVGSRAHPDKGEGDQASILPVWDSSCLLRQ